MYFVDSTKSEESRKYYKIKKSAEITEQIAIEFAQWVDRNKFNIFNLSFKELFQEYLKSKENDKTERTNQLNT